MIVGAPIGSPLGYIAEAAPPNIVALNSSAQVVVTSGTPIVSGGAHVQITNSAVVTVTADVPTVYEAAIVAPPSAGVVVTCGTPEIAGGANVQPPSANVVVTAGVSSAGGGAHVSVFSSANVIVTAGIEDVQPNGHIRVPPIYVTVTTGIPTIAAGANVIIESSAQVIVTTGQISLFDPIKDADRFRAKERTHKYHIVEQNPWNVEIASGTFRAKVAPKLRVRRAQ